MRSAGMMTVEAVTDLDATSRRATVQRYVSFDALFIALRAQARDLGVEPPDVTVCPCCGCEGGGVRSVRATEVRKYVCPGEPMRGCGFVGGPLDWVMAGGLGVGFTNPDQARKAVTLLFAARGWIPDWSGGSAC
ncbi:MAG: hypothetical protein CMH91_01550 [Oceanicaulis sp.]|uniref:hypothetical protein n=1 Tax=unclassified Oceanicaulis TaxID=2632123 RepID=UPI000C37ED84|nr:MULTISPECIES: hypothetical protein [unclassified Oceanicaulis]MBC37733.1 hypothetical protein [Oceanicaulis sp.]MBG36920.1 hypothetical protein [Oceanicaulis sp.]HBU63740.1 hypothetical protein [Oceanicaulis sp.]